MLRLLLIMTLGLPWLPAPAAPPITGSPGPRALAHVRPVDSQPEGRKQLLRELARWSKLGPQSELAQLESMETILRDLERLWTGKKLGQEEIFRGLLDFLGRCVLIAEAPGGLGLGPEPIRLGSITEDGLRTQARGILSRGLKQWGETLTLQILMGREKGQPHPVARRIGACEVLKGDLSLKASLALLSTTRPIPPETAVARTLLNAAVDALKGRDEEGVHLRLLDLQKRAENELENLWMGAIEEHFGSIRLSMSQKRPAEALALHVGEATASADWRRASRGISLGRGLPDDLAFPLLIGALETWMVERIPPAKSSRRIQGEIVRQLEERSGRQLGAHPLRWRSLWEGYLKGEVRWYGQQSDEEGEPLTVGGFFGLRPETDSLVFLLDRSGSMQASFGEDRGQSRLDEAVDQMAGLLVQLGPETKFNVVTFSDGTQSWQRSLEPATPRNIRAASIWVRSAGASGGTRLTAGVRRALELNREGQVDPDSLETDTVIVLCDGGTSEGPAWVGPFLRRVNDEARVVFHAVQLGQGGDGTLEALSAQSGGKFQRVEN